MRDWTVYDTLAFLHLCGLLLPSFFFNDTATTEIYTLSLHDALPISVSVRLRDELYDLRVFGSHAERGAYHPGGQVAGRRHGHQHRRASRGRGGAALRARPRRQRDPTRAGARRIPARDACPRSLPAGRVCADRPGAGVLRPRHAVRGRARAVRGIRGRELHGEPQGRLRGGGEDAVTSRAWRYGAVAGLFVAGVALVVVLNQRTVRSGATSVAPGFHLTNVAAQVGIDFVHHRPTLDPKLDNIAPLIASMGAGVSVVDVNNDGWPDLYLTNSRSGYPNALYVNKGDGTFVDVARAAGVADVNQPGEGVSMGAVWGDFDNDGLEDLLVYKWGYLQLSKKRATC